MATRVLFVDDDPMLLSSMERCLGLRFDIDTALSGPEALELIESGKEYAVVVSDMRMPGMDGIELIQRARALAPKAAYLMLTGNQDPKTSSRAQSEATVTRFLNKPCDPDDIAEAIEDGMREHQAALG